MTAEQMQMMQQMMQMQQMAQMMQGQQTAQSGQQLPPQQPATASPAPVVVKVVLVRPDKESGALVCAEGERTSVQIKVELDSKKEPAGDYATTESVRAKAGKSFPVDGDWSWKLHLGELHGVAPSNITSINGNSAADMDSCWREAFSCMILSKLEPVVFTHPCRPGSEGRDVDRKRTASLSLMTDQAEAMAAASVLAVAHPHAKHGPSKGSGKAVAQLNEDDRVIRLRKKVSSLLEDAQEARFMDPSTGKSCLILTNGAWVPTKFSQDQSKVSVPGFYPEICVEDIDASYLEADGTLKKQMLFFACCSPPCTRKAATNAFVFKPRGRAAKAGKEAAAPCSWFRSEVKMESSSGHHSSKTKDGGIVLVSLWTMMRDHMNAEHGGGFDKIEGNKAAAMARVFSLGAALLQTPAAQASLQEAAAAQAQKTEQGSSPLTPADPPEPPPIVLRFPFDAPTDASERDVAEIRMVDITNAKLAAGSMVSCRVYDLMRRYEFQCALNAGLLAEQVCGDQVVIT